MRKAFFLSVAVAAALVGCSKNESVLPEPFVESVKEAEGETSQINLNITTEHNVISKATGAGHGASSEDDVVGSLDVFIFGGDGELETYQRYEGATLPSLKDLPLKAKTGHKFIYAVANSHRNSWIGVTSLAKFSKECSLLESENTRSFVMIGSKEIDLATVSRVDIEVSRLVARVSLVKLETSFAEGSPYYGQKLSDVKVFLANASSKASYTTGGASGEFLNGIDDVIAGNFSEGVMSGMLCDNIGSIEAAHTTPHYFYCYENSLQDEKKFTRLIIQATLNEHVYYYPYIFKEGIKANNSYSLSVTITAPGAPSPDGKIDYANATVSLSVAPWQLVPNVNVQF